MANLFRCDICQELIEDEFPTWRVKISGGATKYHTHNFDVCKECGPETYEGPVNPEDSGFRRMLKRLRQWKPK